MVGVFDNEFDLVKAFEKVKAKGVKVDEVYTPYPIHEILEGMGKKTHITHAAFFYGLFGALSVLGGMYYAAVVSWPLNFGGKPFNTFPSFLVVTIVATILIVTITTLFTFSARARIFPGKTAKIVHPGATNDKFVIVLKSAEPGFEAAEIEKILKENGATEIIK
ncbi:DUF3341 domain-containing protein [Mangrovibacterium diazotrophicum]|uniref:Quinol:cytochrome c oxidoreductase membrane protein n=1 Tax=Mangrovibacterium diazotrophicum TaxID=1261403 RepID=A0A419W7J5_9BACT|nr:DUF3341 domain-containing protein [Mangrovibacterium diazotrophicum]RKD91428.1 quinol:cytochrome c oxidoreductase membrane protein [Mangrovibacterium diazotrophicum]